MPRCLQLAAYSPFPPPLTHCSTSGPNLRRLYLPGLEGLKSELRKLDFLLERYLPALTAHLNVRWRRLMDLGGCCCRGLALLFRARRRQCCGLLEGPLTYRHWPHPWSLCPACPACRRQAWCPCSLLRSGCSPASRARSRSGLRAAWWTSCFRLRQGVLSYSAGKGGGQNHVATGLPAFKGLSLLARKLPCRSACAFVCWSPVP